jgi:hypothetical protein
MTVDSEIIRSYFEGFDGLFEVQKNYIISSLQLWICSGFLDLLVGSDRSMSLINAHEAHREGIDLRAGFDLVAGRTTLDREELNREIAIFERFGPLCTTQVKPRLFAVTSNCCVAHEFGHQILLILSDQARAEVEKLYCQRRGNLEQRNTGAEANTPGFEAGKELLTAEQIDLRLYISGHAATSVEEYWAESFGVFSFKAGRQQLEKHDPEIFAFLHSLVFEPEKIVQPGCKEILMIKRSQRSATHELTSELLAMDDLFELNSASSVPAIKLTGVRAMLDTLNSMGMSEDKSFKRLQMLVDRLDPAPKS